MAFNGNEGGPIDLDTAATYTKNYREQNEGATQGHFLGRKRIEELLNKPGSMGIRVYYGLDDDGNRELLFVSADTDENDDTSLVIDMSRKCPPICSERNPLNS